MKLIVTVGMPGSGKDELVEVAQRVGMATLKMGDLVRDETRRRGQAINNANISRIANESMKEAHPGQTMSLSDLFEWTNAAIFDDLGARTIPAAHRDFQRRFVDLELQIAFLSSGSMDQLGVPREIQALSRYELRQVRGRLDAAYRAAGDVATRAHIDDLRSRIDAGLHPSATRPL